MIVRFLKNITIGSLILIALISLSLGNKRLSLNNHFLAPKSDYKNVVFAETLSQYISELNALRSNPDAFFALRQEFEKRAKAYCPGEFSMNALDETKKYYRCSFLEKVDANTYYTHSYVFSKKSKRFRYVKTEGDELYKMQILKKIMKLIDSEKKDYSLDEYVFITDPHGAYYNILKLIAHKFGVKYTNIEEEAERIETEVIAKCKYTNYKFNFNGDIPDRAPYTLKTYRLVKRILEEVPGSMYQTGNHDLWAMLNIMGFHLPFYSGYKGIPQNTYSYVSKADLPLNYAGFAEEETFKNREATHELVKVELNEFLAAKQADYPLATDKTWWAEKYRKFMMNSKHAQDIQWDYLRKDVAHLYDKFYDNINLKDFMNQVTIPEDEKRFWGDLLGFSFVSRVKIDVGVLAVERMPFSWWAERSQFLEEVLLPRYEGEIDTTVLKRLNDILKDVTHSLENKLKMRASAGDWTSVVINEGINQGAFASLEWMVADWIFHGADKSEKSLREGSAWGPSALFERILEVLKEHDADAPWAEGEFSYYADYEIQGKDGQTVQLPNCITYLEDKEFVDFGDFLKDNFSVFSKDIYQNTYMHAFFPVKTVSDPNAGKEYIPEFDYKGKNYSRRAIFDGMELMEKDVVASEGNLAALSEPLSLYNSWFAEATTSFKPQHIKNYYNHGISRILDPAGIGVFFSGHNPLQKMGELGIGTNIDNRMFLGDNDMSPRYRNMGLYFDIGINKGVSIYGYSYEDSNIAASPIIISKNKTKYMGAVYNGIGRKPYLSSLKWSLGKEINHLFLKSNNVEHYYVHARNKMVKAAA